MNDELIKRISVDFFYWWYNQPGQNTEQGFDAFWKVHKEKYKPIAAEIDRLNNVKQK